MIRILKLFMGLSLWMGLPAQAGFGPSILDPSLLGGLLTNGLVNEAISSFGAYFAHRPYQGAVTIDEEKSTEFKFETTLVKVGDGLITELDNLGAAGSIQQTPALPTLKMHIRKPMGPTFDVGASGLFVGGQFVAGGDLRFTIFRPEEGLAGSLRFNITYATAKKFYLEDVKTFSPELVFSRKFEFAEPYLGIGGRYAWGRVTISFDVPPLPTFTESKTGSGSTAYAFTGVKFVIGSKGIRLGMEGTYDISGFSSIGSVIGFAI